MDKRAVGLPVVVYRLPEDLSDLVPGSPGPTSHRAEDRGGTPGNGDDHPLTCLRPPYAVAGTLTHLPKADFRHA